MERLRPVRASSLDVGQCAIYRAANWTLGESRDEGTGLLCRAGLWYAPLEVGCVAMVTAGACSECGDSVCMSLRPTWRSAAASLLVVAGTARLRDPPRRLDVSVAEAEVVLEGEKRRRMLDPNEPERVLCGCCNCCASPSWSSVTLTSAVAFHYKQITEQ